MKRWQGINRKENDGHYDHQKPIHRITYEKPFGDWIMNIQSGKCHEKKVKQRRRKKKREENEFIVKSLFKLIPKVKHNALYSLFGDLVR
jgi:hypothetical protein